MKNLNTIVYISVIMLSIVGCNSKNEDYAYINTTINSTLSEYTIKELPENIIYPGNILISEDKLVITQHKTDSIFYIFDVENLEYLYSFGNYGSGPNDFLQMNTDNIIKKKNGFRVYCIDNSILDVDINKRKIINKEQFISDYELFNGFEQLNDSMYVFTNMQDEEYQFVTYNTKNGSITPIIRYPEWIDEEYNEHDLISKIIKYNGHLISNNDGSKIAMFHGYMNCMRLFNSKCDIYKTCILGNECIPYSHDIVYYPIRPQNTEEYIYSVYRSNMGEDVLQKWSWTGELIKSYKLDYKISSFCISDDGKKMYAIIYSDNDICKLAIYNME